MAQEFRINLDVFRGPLDLLLYLVRKQEVEITEVSLAAVTQQYLTYLEVLEQIDLAVVGDFLEVASTLTEMKSRMVLPRGGEEDEAALEETRHDLVRQLLEYKKYRDAASMLEERGRHWQERFARMSSDAGNAPSRSDEGPLRDMQLWDLVGAFSRIMQENQIPQGPSIVYDDTPIYVHMSRISERLMRQRRLAFSELFERKMYKSQLIGIFLALLELIRHQKVSVEQDELFQEIWVVATEHTLDPIDPTQVDNYEHPTPSDESASDGLGQAETQAS
jgi:segregation and condensation protein A